MTDFRCGIANPGLSFSIRPWASTLRPPSLYPAFCQVLCSRGVSVEHPDARAIHLPRSPVLRLGPTPP
jgi:hypothetical protein